MAAATASSPGASFALPLQKAMAVYSHAITLLSAFAICPIVLGGNRGAISAYTALAFCSPVRALARHDPSK